MKRLIFIFILFPSLLQAQSSSHALTLDSVTSNFVRRVQSFPQEKLYLQTDKPYYITGEKIYFRAHLIDALTHVPVTWSHYVYVELINPIDSVVSRLKVKPEDEQFFGQIPLPEDMPEGTYKIRAYTNFMRNAGEDYFFTKTVRIGDPHLIHIKTEPKFSFEEEKKVVMELRFTDLKLQEYLTPKTVKVRLNQGKIVTIKPDKAGILSYKFELSPDDRDRCVYIELEDSRLYKQYIRIPYPENKYEVTFYPEGGNLISGVLCNVAFKALKSNGLPENVTGEFFDSGGNSLNKLASFYEGMGSFLLMPKAGEKYYVIFKNEEGVESRFELPEARPEAFSLKVNNAKDKIWVSVNASPEHPNDTLYLVAQQGGFMKYAEKWDMNKEFVIFNKSTLSSGIVHFMLLDGGMNILSERLAFVMNDDYSQISVETDKPLYEQREMAVIQTAMKDNDAQPLAGTFSIAVTDDKEVKTDTCKNIFEQFLLTSELRGTINCPACYLTGDKKSTFALDLLMMIHGWRRYDVPKVLKGEFTRLSYPLEAGQVVSGVVKGGLLAKPYENAKVSILSTDPQFFSMTETDKNGRFYFQGFEFPDSTRYVVHAANKRGGNNVELVLDADTFPSNTLPWIGDQPSDDRTFIDYVTKADKKYTFENGMRMINLDEVTVKASRRQVSENRSSYYSMADNSITEEELERIGTSSVRNLLYRFPGVQVGPDRISIRGAAGEPLLIIDNMEVNIEMLDDINVFDVAQVDLLKSAHNLAMFGARGANGVIAIYTKTGKVTFRNESFNVKTLTPLGHHQAVEFYSPKYDTPEKKADEKPDLRTTIYWKPNVRLDEALGTAAIEFYTADAETTYTIIIEGMTKDGKIIRYQGRMECK